MQFGDKIRALRIEKGLTQPELAEQLGVEQSWLSKIENNKNLPSSDFLQQCVDTFGISVSELLKDLDADYVRSNLSALPEISRFLTSDSKQYFYKRKQWIVGSSVTCVLGLVLCFSAMTNLFFPNTVQRYVSNGVVYSGEPLNLFDNTRELFSSLNLFEAPEELKNSYGADGVTLVGPLLSLYNEARGRFQKEVLTRQSIHEISSSRVDVANIICPAVLPDGALNIYGNVVTEGQRVYNLHDRTSPNYLNSTVWLIGSLFLIGGLFGFFVDFRLSKLN